MRDQFGREINYARISVTDRCNLRCRYCMPECGVEKLSHDEILTFEEIVRVGKIFARLGIKKFRLTGGEPLLRKNLPALIRELKKIRGVEKITLTTNGVLLKNFSRELIAAGLGGVNLSLDTFDAATFSNLTRRKFFAQVVDGLQTLLADNFLDVKINCVPIVGVNDSEVVELASLAKNHRVKVRFIELMPIGCAFESGLRGVSANELFATLEKVFGELVSVRKKNSLQGPAQYFQPRGFVGEIGFIDALDHKFCAGCNRIRLTAAGFLKPCLSFDGGLDVKNLLRGGVDDEKIFDAIHETIYLKPREHFFDTTTKFQMYQVGG